MYSKISKSVSIPWKNLMERKWNLIFTLTFLCREFPVKNINKKYKYEIDRLIQLNSVNILKDEMKTRRAKIRE